MHTVAVRWTIAVIAIVVALATAALLAVPRNEPPKPSTKEDAVPSAPSTKNTDAKSVRKFSKSGYDITPWTKEQVEAAAKSLTDEQRRVTLHADTERPFCGLFTDNKEEGIYVCVIGGLPLFSTQHQFHSGTGWVSFFAPFDPEHVVEHVDSSLGMTRVEIVDARSGAHLGHVFDDGPEPTGKRYCLNSAALKFIKKGDPIPAESQPALEVAYFAGGCFWGVEDAFEHLPGVLSAESGFAGGKAAKVSYQQVCNGDTGAAETVKVTFDPKLMSYRELVKQFFRIHDPTTPNRQGPDVGDQYRSAIFTTNDAQAKVAKEIIEKLQALPAFKDKRIVTTIAPVANYCKAEDYHQDYHAKNGGSCHIRGFQGDMPF